MSSIVFSVTKDTGQIDQFEQLLTAEVYNSAWRYSCWLSSSRADSEDLLQESLVKAIRGFSKLKDRNCFKSWLLKIVRTTFLMQRRKQTSGINAITGTLEDSGASLVDLSSDDDSPDMSEQMAQAISKLPPDQREIVSLFYFENLSLKEVAEVIGITPNAVTQRLHRIRHKLRSLINEAGVVQEVVA